MAPAEALPAPGQRHLQNLRRRERSASTGASDIEKAKLKLDVHYLENTRGEAICPTCGQPRPGAGHNFLLADAIANFLATEVDDKSSVSAIRARLAHVINYLTTVPRDVTCSEVDEEWVKRFRKCSTDSGIPRMSPRPEPTRTTPDEKISRGRADSTPGLTVAGCDAGLLRGREKRPIRLGHHGC